MCTNIYGDNENSWEGALKKRSTVSRLDFFSKIGGGGGVNFKTKNIKHWIIARPTYVEDFYPYVGCLSHYVQHFTAYHYPSKIFRKNILTNWGFSTLSSDLKSRVSSFSLSNKIFFIRLDQYQTWSKEKTNAGRPLAGQNKKTRRHHLWTAIFNDSFSSSSDSRKAFRSIAAFIRASKSYNVK